MNFLEMTHKNKGKVKKTHYHTIKPIFPKKRYLHTLLVNIIIIIIIIII